MSKTTPYHHVFGSYLTESFSIHFVHPFAFLSIPYKCATITQLAENQMKNISNTKDVNLLDKNDIYSFWPMKDTTPRISQEKVLDWVKDLPSTVKYIICELPVGSGKSPLALNLSGWFNQGLGSGYILTPQKILQRQYEDSFDDTLLHSLYGKANYRCETKGTSCELGSEIKPQCDSCPHKAAFMKVKYTPNVVFNYTLAFLLFKYVVDEKVIRKRDIIVFDEAHTIETHLTEFNAISISEFRCKQLGIPFKKQVKMGEAITWLKDTYMPALLSKIKKLGTQVQEILDECSMDSRAPSRDELNTISLHKELVAHADSINEQLILQPYDTVYGEYVLINESNTVFKFKELYGRKNFKRYVLPMADRFLFMSSTILDKDAFCDELGIDPNEAAFISVESEFDVDNRPVIYIPTARMTYGWNTPERRKESNLMYKRIAEILNSLHPDESGIIHTGSFQVSDWLATNLQNKIPHYIMHHNPGGGKNRDSVIDEFQQLDGVPKLLLSPSITEGLDLKDDKGRFAIFAKVPFPYLGDAWVKKRMELSEAWYRRQALISMIQGGGRVVRSSDDWGHVYILDSSFIKLLNTSKRMLPKWWLDSISTMS